MAKKPQATQSGTNLSNVVGISQRAMLVTQIIRFKGWSRKDAEITSVVSAQYAADAKSMSVGKILIAPQYLADLRSAKGELYKHHCENTLPWGNWGQRLLPSENYLTYTQEQRRLTAVFDAAADAFAAQYQAAMQEAVTRLGAAFRSDDYPDPTTIRERYQVQHDFEPLPEAGDFRVKIAREDRDRLVKAAHARIQARVNDAVADLWGRLEESLTVLRDRVTAYDDQDTEKRKVWRTEWLENVRAVVDVIPALNFTDDARLTEIATTARSSILRFEDDELKENAAARREAVASVDTVMDKMAGFFGPAPTAKLAA